MPQLIPREEFFTPTNKDTGVKKQPKPLGHLEVQLNANVDGTEPDLDTRGMDKAAAIRLRDGALP